MKLEKRCVDDSLREVEQSSGRLTESKYIEHHTPQKESEKKYSNLH